MDKEEMYKPLPSFLTVDKSEIHGLGIFATRDIANQTNLGLSHVIIEKPNIFLRTPLGGFINHVSENPNCVLVGDITFTNLFFIMAIRHIKSGEELTITYQSYNPEEE